MRSCLKNMFTFIVAALLISISCPCYLSFAKTVKSYNDVILADSRLTSRQIASGFGFPTGMVFIEPDEILVIEKNTGRVILIQNGIELDKPVIDVNIANNSERGLLGIAVSEKNNSTATRYVFLYFTETESKDGGTILGNRLYRYEMINNTLINPKLLLDLPFLPGPSHNGGVLKIGPDKKSIYLVIGNLNFMQNLTYMTKTQNVKDGPPPDGRGGILRVTFDGLVVGGKGLLGNSHPINKYYGYGLRNSFGIGFDPLTGNLWDTENG